MPDHRVLVIGGGIAGLTAAKSLAVLGARVDLVERRAVLGGHAAQFACKATDRCVKCGACLVTEAVASVVSDPRITVYPLSRVEGLRRTSRRFDFAIERGQATASGGDPWPESRQGSNLPMAACADAVVLAAGFEVFDPQDTAYGHGIYPNVVTNLELERRLRESGGLNRPSDGAAPRRVAFIQCVGSRDAHRGHLWCSQFCCAAALRAALRIKAQRPETEITIFYIDIQSFGRDFESFYRQCRQTLRFVRAIPIEAFEVQSAGIRLSYTESARHSAQEEVFDLVVLSTGMAPAGGLADIAGRLATDQVPTAGGFAAGSPEIGIFAAGAVRGPMGIADSIADARRAAAGVMAFLGLRPGRPLTLPTTADASSGDAVLRPGT
jgi:heterodisulfide reductase subunit A